MRTLYCTVEVFFFQTDIGISRAARRINLPEPESSEKDPVLSIAEQCIRGPAKELALETHQGVKVENYCTVRS